MPIPQNKTLTKESSKDQAYRQIRDWIIEGTLEPGEKLAETSLAEAVHISRTPVREALLRLEADGFVILPTGKVTRVTELDLAATENLFLSMSALEGITAAQATQHADGTFIQRLTKLHQNYETALGTGELKKVIKTDRAFHRAILDLADNQYTSRFSDLLYGHITRLEMQTWTDKTILQRLANHHEAIIAAFESGAPLEAKTATESDWLDVLALF